MSISPRTPDRFLGTLTFVVVLGVFFRPANEARARVEVHVTHVGFPGIDEGDLVRAGSWIPVIVDVSLSGEASFDGTVRIAQRDGDGDECFDSVELHLRGETGEARRVVLYALANPAPARGGFAVEVRGDDGEAVKVLSQGELTYQASTAEVPTVVAEDHRLLLLVSSGVVGRLVEVETELKDRFLHTIRVAHISPTDLPEQWIGLDAVDYIIWDDARAEDLRGRQLAALLDWVRHGGTMLMASSRSAPSLKLSKALDAVLPVDVADVAAVENLPEARKALFDPTKGDGDFRGELIGWETVPFATRVPVARFTVRGEAKVLAEDPAVGGAVMVRRRLDRGHLLFSGVAIRDLLSVPGGLGKFFMQVFQLRTLERPDEGRATCNSLYEQVVSAVAFATSGSLYLLGAALFSVVYALAATFGLWKLLGIRGWRHHSWSAFAVTGVLASVVSLMSVGWMRGLGDRLHQMVIVDADAGSSYGHATAYFGLKTSLDKEVDVWMPSDWHSADEPRESSCFLRPLPASSEPLEGGGRFADPEEYRLMPASAVVDDVRIRATLKRFEGRWEGSLGGRLTGRVAIRGREISEDSYVVNQLGVDLTHCYLLQPVLNPTDVATGRDHAIYAYPLDDVPSNGSRIGLHERCYRRGPAETLSQVMNRQRLESAQMEWSSRFQSLFSQITYRSAPGGQFAVGAEQDALLLLSTLGEFDAETIPGQVTDVGSRQTWSRDRMRRLDLREQLYAGRAASDKGPAEPGSVVLLGFARSPGPVRLFGRSGDRDFRVIQPDAASSWCLYRIFIPTTRVDAAAGAGNEGTP